MVAASSRPPGAPGGTVSDVRQVFPSPADEVDPVRCYADDERIRPDGRPWVLVNMIVSVDGATASDGVSGGLGGPADRQVFSAIRGVADIIVAAAGTVRAEGYGPPRTPDAIREQRRERGQSDHPRLAVISRSLQLDLTSALFTDSDPPPLVITAPGADAVRRAEVASRADVALAGQGDRVELDAAIGLLGDLGASIVLVEGGPTLNGQLLDADLVDEVCVTVSPTLVGGDSRRLMHGARRADAVDLRLARILEQSGLLFLRYVREGTANR